MSETHVTRHTRRIGGGRVIAAAPPVLFGWIHGGINKTDRERDNKERGREESRFPAARKRRRRLLCRQQEMLYWKRRSRPHCARYRLIEPVYTYTLRTAQGLRADLSPYLRRKGKNKIREGSGGNSEFISRAI